MAKPFKVKKLSPTDPIEYAAVRILKSRLREFYSHWPVPGEIPTAESLHDMRISGKRLRYSAEMLRELYEDKLALLIELMKRSQDLMGDYQDCVTQRQLLGLEINRISRRNPSSQEIPILHSIIELYVTREHLILGQFQDIWRGMSRDKFLNSIRAMIKNEEWRMMNGE